MACAKASPPRSSAASSRSIPTNLTGRESSIFPRPMTPTSLSPRPTAIPYGRLTALTPTPSMPTSKNPSLPFSKNPLPLYPKTNGEVVVISSSTHEFTVVAVTVETSPYTSSPKEKETQLHHSSNPRLNFVNTPLRFPHTGGIKDKRREQYVASRIFL